MRYRDSTRYAGRAACPPMGARCDEMDPQDMKNMAQLLPNATAAFCDKGRHLCAWDDQESYFKRLLDFRRGV